MKPFIQRLISLFSERERFLVVHADGAHMKTFQLALDKERALVPEDIQEYERPVKERRAGTPAFPGPVIIAVEFPHAMVASFPIRFEREHPKDPIIAIELENALAQAVGKAFTQSRKDAGELFGVDELDVMLAGSAVVEFAVQGHRVMNPVGFTGKIVTGVLELTLTRRDLLEDIHRLVGRRDFFFTHMGRAAVKGLEDMGKAPMALVKTDEEGSWVASMGGKKSGSLLRNTPITWSPSEFLSSIEDAWGVSHETAKRIYDAYCEGRVSERSRQFLRRLFEEDLKALCAELAVQKIPPRVCLVSPVRFPEPFPFKKGKYLFVEPPHDGVVKRIGVVFAPGGAKRASGEWFMVLAPLVEWYSNKSDSTINHWLRRHLNWLGASRG